MNSAQPSEALDETNRSGSGSVFHARSFGPLTGGSSGPHGLPHREGHGGSTASVVDSLCRLALSWGGRVRSGVSWQGHSTEEVAKQSSGRS